MNKLIDIETDFLEDEETNEVMYGPSDEELEKLIIKEYKLGVGVQDIADMYGISYGRFYEILRRNNVPLRYGRHERSKSARRLAQMTEKEKQNLIKDYQNGMPLTHIYEKYNINKYGCYTILDEANVPRKVQQSETGMETVETSDKKEPNLLDNATISSSVKPQTLENRYYDGVYLAHIHLRDGVELKIMQNKDCINLHVLEPKGSSRKLNLHIEDK